MVFWFALGFASRRLASLGSSSLCGCPVVLSSLSLNFPFDTETKHLHCEYMKRSVPLARRPIFGSPSLGLVVSRQSSAGFGFLPRTFSRRALHAARHSVRHLGAFTLMELMITVALVAILAGLTMASFGYVNKKAAESKARAEVAALSAAVDRYQADFGSCPPCAPNLFKELVGEGTLNTNTLYFEPSEASRKAQLFLSPWGTPYGYNSTNAEELRNVGSFDLWAEPPGAESEEDWIHN